MALAPARRAALLDLGAGRRAGGRGRLRRRVPLRPRAGRSAPGPRTRPRRLPRLGLQDARARAAHRLARPARRAWSSRSPATRRSTTPASPCSSSSCSRACSTARAYDRHLRVARRRYRSRRDALAAALAATCPACASRAWPPACTSSRACRASRGRGDARGRGRASAAVGVYPLALGDAPTDRVALGYASLSRARDRGGRPAAGRRADRDQSLSFVILRRSAMPKMKTHSGAKKRFKVTGQRQGPRPPRLHEPHPREEVAQAQAPPRQPEDPRRARHPARQEAAGSEAK